MIIDKKTVNNILKKILKEDYKLLSNESLNSFYGKYYYYLQTSYNIITEIYNLFLMAKKEDDVRKFKVQFDMILNNQNYNEIFKYSNELLDFNLDEISKDLQIIRIIDKNFKFIESLMSRKDIEPKFFEYLEPLIVNFNKKIVTTLSQLKNKLAGTKKEQTLSKSTNNPNVVKNILVLETLAYSYISEIENLFRKIQSISVDLSADNNKDWEDYNLLNSQNYSRLMMQFLQQKKDSQKTKSDNFKKIQDQFNNFIQKNIEKIQKYSRFNVTNGQPKDKTVFNKKQFLSALYNPKKTTSTDYSSKKALIITKSLENIDLKDKQIKNNLQSLGASLWNKEENKYYEDFYVKMIFSSMLKVKNIYKVRLNKLISIIEKENDLSKMLFEIGKECDLFLKFLSFSKLDIRANLLKMITNNNISVDSEKLFNQYKNNVNDKMTKSLIYWNLFKNLGWISASEPPEWMYGNITSEAKSFEHSPDKLSKEIDKITTTIK